MWSRRLVGWQDGPPKAAWSRPRGFTRQAAGWRGARRAPSPRARSEANATGRRIVGPALLRNRFHKLVLHRLHGGLVFFHGGFDFLDHFRVGCGEVEGLPG